MQFLSDLGQALANFVVPIIASLTAQVLQHPLVVDAAANLIVVGLKKLCHEPDLDNHVDAVSEVLSKRMDREALRAGRGFPKAVGHFVKGMMSPSSPSAMVESTPSPSRHADASVDGKPMAQKNATVGGSLSKSIAALAEMKDSLSRTREETSNKKES